MKRGLVDQLFRLEFLQNFRGAAINIGNPIEITVRELAELVLKQTGSLSKIVHLDLPVDDPKQRRPDIKLAKRKLGWVPNVSLKRGLEKTIPYFSAELERLSLQGAIEMS